MITQQQIDTLAELLGVAREAVKTSETRLEMALEAFHNISPGDIVRDTEKGRLMVVRSLHFANYRERPLVAGAVIKHANGSEGTREFWLGSNWEHA